MWEIGELTCPVSPTAWSTTYPKPVFIPVASSPDTVEELNRNLVEISRKVSGLPEWLVSWGSVWALENLAGRASDIVGLLDFMLTYAYVPVQVGADKVRYISVREAIRGQVPEKVMETWRPSSSSHDEDTHEAP